MPADHYIYQRIHTLAGKSLHLREHLELAARAFRHIYGGEQPVLDERVIASQIAEVLRANNSPARGSAVVMLRLAPQDNSQFSILNSQLTAEYIRTLLDVGYAVSSLRPTAVSYEYAIPFGGFPTGFQLSAAALFDHLALAHHGATRSVRRDGDKLISCGGEPLFGIQGKTLFTASFNEGAVESVERQLIIAAAKKARLDFLEEAVLHSELTSFDELFYADAAGITSLAECDGAKFMSLTVPRLIAAI
jgi:branched-subunit amino acid aminotransferase/4-amino-4-deoxychorismate lyase